MESGEGEKLKQMEDENRKLKHVVAELTLDKWALKRRAFQNRYACGTSSSRELCDAAGRDASARPPV
jgi:hypothetical protein